MSTPTPTRTSTATSTATATPAGTPGSRVIHYTYDGLRRLIGAAESPGNSFAYTYDAAGNRTSVAVNGTTTASYRYDAADQVVGWSYDAAGNLTSDGTTTYSYDALHQLTGTSASGQTRGYTYNGDGTLVRAVANGVITSYARDLASDQSALGGRRSWSGPPRSRGRRSACAWRRIREPASVV